MNYTHLTIEERCCIQKSTETLKTNRRRVSTHRPAYLSNEEFVRIQRKSKKIRT